MPVAMSGVGKDAGKGRGKCWKDMRDFFFQISQHQVWPNLKGMAGKD
jgi:hypothetical protein